MAHSVVMLWREQTAKAKAVRATHLDSLIGHAFESMDMPANQPLITLLGPAAQASYVWRWWKTRMVAKRTAILPKNVYEIRRGGTGIC